MSASTARGGGAAPRIAAGRFGRRVLPLLGALYLVSVLLPSGAAAAGGEHDRVFGEVLLGLIAMLFAANLGGELALRIGQPAVLGELTLGVILGNLTLLGWGGMEPLASDTHLAVFAEIGVLILLFEVGLESTVGEMLRVGSSSLLVAVVGVAIPWALGFGIGRILLPDHSDLAHLFLGAILTATSVGITARVFQELGRLQSSEAKIVLGAAVIDDILGLVILSMVTGVVKAADAGVPLSYVSLGAILVKASLFLVGALVIGLRLSPRVFRAASSMRRPGVLITVALSFCFLLAWVAGRMGLAPIVGAFAAGLILERAHTKPFTDRGEVPLERLIAPIASFLVPLFFVLMGMRVELSTFADPKTLGLAAAITAAAIVGKQACSLAALGKGLDRVTIGIGMIPRGEVGLIFAGIGATLTIRGERVVDEGIYSAVVLMVIVTTLVTPPALQWSLARATRRGAARQASAP